MLLLYGNMNVHELFVIGKQKIQPFAPPPLCQCVRNFFSFKNHFRFTEVEDYRWYFKTIERVCDEELGTKYSSAIKEEHWFVDFLRLNSICLTSEIFEK